MKHVAALSRALGSRALSPSRVRERGPLGELTGLQVAALGAAPARSPPRSPAKPVAGPLNTGFSEVPAAAAALQVKRSAAAALQVKRSAAAPLLSQRPAARPPRQSLACGSLGGTSAAEPPLFVIVRSAALQPLRQASWHIGCDAALPVGRWQPVRQSSHRAPPSCAPVPCEGDLWGDLHGGGPGNWLTASAAEEHHPSPSLPVREGRNCQPPEQPAHPPPARGRERGSPSRRISFKRPGSGSGGSF